MNGSASRPSSATMNGTRCAIRPATKATSRESRSSFETRTQHLPWRAAASAAASCGHRSRASAPLPVSASTYSAMIADGLGFGKPLDGSSLRLDSKARALLLPYGDAVHTKGIPPFALWMNPLSEQCHCSFHVAAANACAAEHKVAHA